MPGSKRLRAVFAARLVAIPGNLDFGRVSPGASEDRLLRLRNDGAAPSRCCVTASSPFSVVSEAEFVLKPGATSELRIRFACPAWGVAAGAITIDSDSGTRTVYATAGTAFGDVFEVLDREFCFGEHPSLTQHPPAHRQTWRDKTIKDVSRPGAMVNQVGLLLHVVPGTSNLKFKDHPWAVFVSSEDWHAVSVGRPLIGYSTFLLRFVEPNLCLPHSRWRCAFPDGRLPTLHERWKAVSGRT